MIPDSSKRDPESSSKSAPLAARLVEPSQLETLIAQWRKWAKDAWTSTDPLPGCSSVWEDCADELEAALPAGRLVDPSPLDIERELRMEWWLNHGLKCMPYGDDGEMQCCGLDFKRMPLNELRPRVNELRLKRISESIQQAARVDPSPLAQLSENKEVKSRVDKGIGSPSTGSTAPTDGGD